MHIAPRTVAITLGACALSVVACTLCEGVARAAAPPREGEYQGGFSISSRVVIPDARYIARYRVLGAEISDGEKYDMPVTVEIRIGSETHVPFGAYGSPTAGNVNDGEHPKDFILTEQHDAGTAFTIRGRSWNKVNGTDGTADSHWKAHLSVGSSENSPNLIVLRHGDPVPQIEPFLDQKQIGDIVRDYVDPVTDTIRLWEDEAIFLFELGVTDLSSPAADFQDLVVLVTLAEDAAYFDPPRIQPNALYD